MDKIPTFAEMMDGYLNGKKSLGDAAADLGAIILSIDHEKKYYGEHTQNECD